MVDNITFRDMQRECEREALQRATAFYISSHRVLKEEADLSILDPMRRAWKVMDKAAAHFRVLADAEDAKARSGL